MNLKRIYKNIFAVAAAAMLMFSSCNNDDGNYIFTTDPVTGYANALVTVKNVDDGTFFLQLTDDEALLPSSYNKPPYDKEVRALVNFSEIPKEDYPKYIENGDLRGCKALVKINWMDSILTKMPVPDLAEKNDETYGTDCVEIVDDWVTIAEDGYLTLRFRTLWGGNRKHIVNLISGVDPENPYTVEFRHNAQGDVNGMWGDALVAFNLNGLPDTNGKTVKLQLRWKSYLGDKKVEFDYCSRKASGGEIPTGNLISTKMLN